MFRKLLCKLGIHESEIKVISNSNYSLKKKKEYALLHNGKNYDVFIMLNLECKHCGKVVGTHLIKVKLEEENK